MTGGAARVRFGGVAGRIQSGKSALPLIPLPGPSPRKDGEKGIVATPAPPPPFLRGEGKGEGQRRLSRIELLTAQMKTPPDYDRRRSAGKVRGRCRTNSIRKVGAAPHPPAGTFSP